MVPFSSRPRPPAKSLWTLDCCWIPRSKIPESAWPNEHWRDAWRRLRLAPLVLNNRKSESKPVPSHSRCLPPKDRKAPTPCRWFNPSAMCAFSPGRWNSTKDPNAAKLSSAVASTLKSRPTAGQSAAASTSPPAGRCSLENQSWRKPSERDGPTQACWRARILRDLFGSEGWPTKPIYTPTEFGGISKPAKPWCPIRSFECKMIPVAP